MPKASANASATTGKVPPAGGGRNPTAAILLIGNEILSGKVQDENARFLTGELRDLGVSLRRIEVVPDDVDDIAASVRALAERFDTVFMSGGVGPTHDDVTMAAVARAFGMSLVRHPDLEAMLRASFGDRLHERDLRMADIPSGARLERGPAATGGTWPVTVVRNVWVLPGVPSIFRRKFAAIRELHRAPPSSRERLYSRAEEDRSPACWTRQWPRSPASRSARTRTPTPPTTA